MTDTSVGSSQRPLRVAVVGSGPAGFYAAGALFKQKDYEVTVDLFERLPCPYGLVRYGVAPDHQKIKGVTRVFDKTASPPNFRLFANVHIGRDITADELREHYDQVVLTVGCETDRRMAIPGENGDGCYAATSFVAWYNGHPDYQNYSVNLEVPRAAIIGVGDVSMDITRMLVKGAEALATTDITEQALTTLRRSQIRDVYIVARRGWAQSAFAQKELSDIAALPHVQVHVDAEQVSRDLEAHPDLSSIAKRKLEYLVDLGKQAPRRDATHHVHFRFLRSPKELTLRDGKVDALDLEENTLVRSDDGWLSAQGTGNIESLAVGAVFRAVGYRGVPLPGLPFDQRRGLIPNDSGRVVDAETGERVPGVYASGWIKRGPSGVIGTNKTDSVETVSKMLEDVPTLTVSSSANESPSIDELIKTRNIQVIDLPRWQTLDTIERERGSSKNKVREKLTSAEAAWHALGG